MKLILLFMGLIFFQNQQKRVVAVYTTNVNNPAYLQQLRLLNVDIQGLEERDIVIEKYIKHADNDLGFKQHHITGNFMITLTGKDGGEKYRNDKPVTAAKLFAIIDAMPMRKDEMKARHQ